MKIVSFTSIDSKPENIKANDFLVVACHTF